jgi:hypothetical protein
MPVLPTSSRKVPWAFLFPVLRMAEKCIAEITVRLSDTLKRDLQDLAMEKDRKLSDMIRILLEVSLYGLKHRRDEACGLIDSCGASRGNE